MLEHDLPKREPLMLTVPTTDFGFCLYVAKCQRLTIRSDLSVRLFASSLYSLAWPRSRELRVRLDIALRLSAKPSKTIYYDFHTFRSLGIVLPAM